MRGLLIAAALAAGLGSALAEPAPPEGSSAVADALCQQLAGSIKQLDVSACRAAGLRPSPGVKSVSGVALLEREFPPLAPSAGHGRVPRVLLIGAIHGDELSASAVVFQWIEFLKSDRFQRFDWRVLPCANPDGILAKPSHRTNGHKVDLNRNFPTPDWNERALSYWASETKRDPRRYPGPSAASEPETRWIMDEIASFKPDAIVSVHAPYNVLDFDGPKEPPKKLGYLLLEPLGVYPGSLGNYAGVHLKVPVITLELPQSTQPPSATQSGRIWADLLSWLDKNLVTLGEPAAKP